jgi:serine/threonine-protein kinase
MASFGKVAIKMGFINQDQLDEAVRVQNAAAKAGLRKRLGDILVKKGYISPEQLQKVLKGQTANRKRIGAYELISKLGEGGMGSVFRARQVFMDREIALKILSPKMAKNKDFLRRFVREARAVAKLNHPHIVAGIDVGSADGYCYFAMEFVDGETLGEYTHRCGGKLKEKVALDYIHQMALALQHAHENNLLHRDVKPDNILLDKEHKVAKLADLGLVRSAESKEDDAALTQAGQAVGTPFYISPEQARGLTDLSPATDLYSLGATLFHLITGEVPFDGATAAVIMTRHLTDPVPSPRKVNPQVSKSTDRIVQRLMQKKPDDRYKSMHDLAEDIQRVIDGEEIAGDDPIVTDVVPDAPPPPKKERTSERVHAPERSHTPEKPAAVLPEREATRQVSTTGNFAATRRRYKRNRELASLGVAFAIILGCLAVLYYWNPLKETSASSPPPAASPIVFQTAPDGGRIFSADFTRPLANFTVDPAVFTGDVPKIQTSGNRQMLSFAQVKGASGCMVRLVLPPDLILSPNATLLFSVFAGPKTGVSPDIEVRWEHMQTPGNRVVAKWAESNPKYIAGWSDVKLKLSDLTSSLSNEPLSKPQHLDIFAAKQNQGAFACIYQLEIHDPTPVTAPAIPAPPPDKKESMKAPLPRDAGTLATPAPAPVTPPAVAPAPAPQPAPAPSPAPAPDKKKSNKSPNSAIEDAL